MLLLRLAGLLLLGWGAWVARSALGSGSLADVQAVLQNWGPSGPAAFVVLYAAGVCLLVPGSVLTVAGGVLFGPYAGSAWVWLGALLGSSGAFCLGRWLGRDAVARLFGARLAAWESLLARRGFAVVALARLAWAPFTPLSFAFGLTKVRFRDYFWGTALGMTPGTLAFTWLVGTTASGLAEPDADAAGTAARAAATGAVVIVTLAGVWIARTRLPRLRGMTAVDRLGASREGERPEEAPPPAIGGSRGRGRP